MHQSSVQLDDPCLVLDNEHRSLRLHEPVELSQSGMTIHAPITFDLGQCLQLKIRSVDPSLDGARAEAVVVGCQPVPETDVFETTLLFLGIDHCPALDEPDRQGMLEA